ncbi:phosphoribosylanthranilate isomerase [bacterium]|nr:phosphoribosylanthranilate isomerase [bacterium]
MRVKICGLTRDEDARAACDLGAWAIGMILSRRGPRALDRARAERVRRAIAPGVLAVGVFADEPAEKIAELASALSLDLVQLHGREPPGLLESLATPAIKAFPIDALSARAPDPAELRRFERAFGAIFDAKVGEETGGTGRSFDWSCLDDAALRAALPGGRLILAGGLGPGNVALAVSRARPFAVDLASGVESSPGIKDRAKLEFLFRALPA